MWISSIAISQDLHQRDAGHDMLHFAEKYDILMYVCVSELVRHLSM